MTQPAPTRTSTPPTVLAVCLSPTHTFSKLPQPHIHLLAGIGVEGDAHAGRTVQHRYHVRKDPTRPNHTQVHLLQSELFADLSPQFSLNPGQLGENITTAGIDLLSLPLATRLHLGPQAVIELTGLRTPCTLIDRFQPGLQAAVTRLTPGSPIHRRAGVMAIVLTSGTVHPNNPIRIELPPEPHQPLQPV